MGIGIGQGVRRNALGNFATLLDSDPLVSIDWEGRVAPRLAERLEWLDGDRTLKLVLRSNVVFHDGAPLTSDAVVRVLRQQVADNQPPSEFLQSIEAAGSDTVLIRLTRPDSLLPERLNGVEVRPPGHPDVGTGPFRIVSQNPLRFVANDKYYRKRPSIDEIRVHTYDTQRGAWAAMMRGEIDYLHDVSREAADFVEAESSVNTYPYLAAYYIPMVFNLRHPILKRVEVRRALNEAIDRQSIVTQAMHGRGIPSDGPLWPQYWAISSAQRTYAFNPDAARVRLDAAGLPVVPSTDSTHVARRFKFTCLFWSEEPLYERVALIVQKQLFEIGVDVEMQPVPGNRLFERMQKADYEAFMVPTGSGRALGWTYNFWHTSAKPGAGLETGYTSADPILDHLRLVTSDDDTRQGVAELQRVLFDEPPAVFLVWLMNARAVSTRFDVPHEPNRDIMSNLWQWRQNPAAVRAAQ